MSFTTRTITIADSPYTCATTDNLILVDLSGLSGGSDGPEVHLVTPVGTPFPVTVRNINGDSGVHNLSVWPPVEATGGLQNPFDLPDFTTVYPSGLALDRPALTQSTWQYNTVTNAWGVVVLGSTLKSVHGFKVAIDQTGVVVTKAATLGGVQAPLAFPLSRQDAQELALLLLSVAG